MAEAKATNDLNSFSDNIKVNQAAVPCEADSVHLYDRRFQIPFVPFPQQLDLPFQVKLLACGSFHSMVLSTSGQLFGCGLATHG